MRLFPSCVLLGVVGFSGCVPIGRLEPAPGKVEQSAVYLYKVGLYDTLGVVVWQNEELSTEVVVRPDGRISVPLLGEIMVLDRTPGEIEQEITTALSRFIKAPKVSVIVKDIKSLAFTVAGNVKTPGRFTLYKDLTVLEGIALAGGFTEYADTARIFIQRSREGTVRRIHFDFNAFLSGENLGQDYSLTAGDLIVVP